MSLDSSTEQDRGLVRRLKRRDPNAMMEVYDRYSRLLYSIVLRAVSNGSIAEDITQETFLRVWNRINTFDEEKGNFEGWLVTVARNRAFDYLRSVRNAPESTFISLTDLERTSCFPANEGGAHRLALVETVKGALSGLNRDQREVIELTHFEGMTQTEIAGRLKKPLGTVKGLVRSALKSLRSAMLTTTSSYAADFPSSETIPSAQVRHDL